MIYFKKLSKLSFVLAIMLSGSMYAQEYSTEELYEMDLAELMEIQVVSASKKLESLFEAPLSTSVITHDDIISSGATSIPEVLKLVPGVIVREQTNGNYDIHIRGNDYLPNGYRSENSINNNTLIMIDNRIIFSNFQGGIFWETLPVSVTDIERIEVIRGPSSALYGPNAVNGVIHIITSKVDSEGLQLRANGQAGSAGTMTGSATANYGISDKFGVQLSGNFAARDRFEDSYYAWSENKFYPYDTINARLDNRADLFYPEAQQALQKYGVNGGLFYKANEDIHVDLTFGNQQSDVKAPYIERVYGINSRGSNSSYVNLNSKVYDFSIHAAYNTGNMKLMHGAPEFHFDEDRIEFSTEYDLTMNKVTLRPGISYQSSTYTTDPYTAGNEFNNGIIQGDKTIDNLAFSLRTDYKLSENTRFILAYRADKYNVPEDIYHSYQFIATQKFGENHLLRGVYSRANQGSFVDVTYMNLEIPTYGQNGQQNGVLTIAGSQDMDLRTTDMLELNLRSKWADVFSTDFELFYTYTDNYLGTDVTEMRPVNGGQYYVPSRIEYMNIDLSARQVGATFNVNYMPVENTIVKLWLTTQQTQLSDYAPDPGKLDSTINMAHNYTPSLYGGMMVDYEPLDKLNINLNAYYMGSSSFDKIYTDNNTQQNTYYDIDLADYVSLNAKVSYKINSGVSVFANARNLFMDQRQFAFGEQIGSTYLFGMNVDF